MSFALIIAPTSPCSFFLVYVQSYGISIGTLFRELDIDSCTPTYYYQQPPSCRGDVQQRKGTKRVPNAIYRGCAFAAPGAVLLVSSAVGVGVVEVEVAAG